MRTAMNSGLVSLRPAECLKCLNGHGCLFSAALVCITETARRRRDAETSHNVMPVRNFIAHCLSAVSCENRSALLNCGQMVPCNSCIL